MSELRPKAKRSFRFRLNGLSLLTCFITLLLLLKRWLVVIYQIAFRAGNCLLENRLTVIITKHIFCLYRLVMNKPNPLQYPRHVDGLAPFCS